MFTMYGTLGKKDLRNQNLQFNNVASGINPARYSYCTLFRISSYKRSNNEDVSRDGEPMTRTPMTGPASDLTILGYDRHDGTDDFHRRKNKSIDQAWDSYRASFTMVMSKGYLRAVDELREKMMSVEWKENQRKVALQMGIAKFEDYCFQSQVQISNSILKQLYEDPENFDLIEDDSLRMRLRSIVKQTEADYYFTCYKDCTDDARRIAQQFSEVRFVVVVNDIYSMVLGGLKYDIKMVMMQGEFISQLLPDPVEHGLLKSIEMLVESFRIAK